MLPQAGESADPAAAADPSAAAPYDHPAPTTPSQEAPWVTAQYADPLRAATPNLAPRLPAGVIAVDAPGADGGDPSAGGAGGGLSEPFHDAQADVEGMDDDVDGGGVSQGGGGSKRQKLKEGISSLFSKGPKKDL